MGSVGFLNEGNLSEVEFSYASGVVYSAPVCVGRNSWDRDHVGWTIWIPRFMITEWVIIGLE